MNRLQELLLAAYAPLAMRHTLVEGRFARLRWRTRPGAMPDAAKRRIDAPVVRLFAVQIR